VAQLSWLKILSAYSEISSLDLVISMIEREYAKLGLPERNETWWKAPEA
jgi:hypothetical protein